MAGTRTKSTGRVKPRARRKGSVSPTPKRAKRKKTKETFAKPYDAKKYEGSVPAFASVVAEEMKSWRDDR